MWNAEWRGTVQVRGDEDKDGEVEWMVGMGKRKYSGLLGGGRKVNK